MGLEFTRDHETHLYVGHLPDRKSGTIAIRRGSTIDVVAYFRSEKGMADLQEVLLKMFDAKKVPPKGEEDADVRPAAG